MTPAATSLLKVVKELCARDGDVKRQTICDVFRGSKAKPKGGKGGVSSNDSLQTFGIGKSFGLTLSDTDRLFTRLLVEDYLHETVFSSRVSLVFQYRALTPARFPVCFAGYNQQWNVCEHDIYVSTGLYFGFGKGCETD